MAGLSKQLQTMTVNWVRGIPSTTPPAALFVALSTTRINDDGTGMTEPSGLNGYARQPLTLGAPLHVEGAGTSTTNTIPVIFGPATNQNWPTITHAAVVDGSGTVIFSGPVASPRTAPVGDTLSYGVGVLQFNVH